MTGDFDELTQSSDTATDDIDSPTSGYRHASLLIQKLDSVTLDSRSMVKLQNIFHEYERCIQKARSRHGYLADKVSQLDIERAELKSSLEEVKDVKSALERNQLELQTEVTNLKFQLKQEQENRRNATMMYNTTRDKLRRMEEQHQLEVQERQKVELSLRNLELEMRTLLEEDHSETQRLLAQERSARTLQENLLSSHLRKQQEIEADNKRNIKKVNGDLKDQLASLKSSSSSSDQLERSKRQLEEEVLDLRRRMEASQMEQSHVEQYRLDAEERARYEIKQKLEQVNIFLQSQAASQEALDQIKAANETNLRSQLEQKIRELEGELGRARTTHHDSLNQRDSTRTELERYRQLYTEELRLRKSLVMLVCCRIVMTAETCCCVSFKALRVRYFRLWRRNCESLNSLNTCSPSPSTPSKLKSSLPPLLYSSCTLFLPHSISGLSRQWDFTSNLSSISHSYSF
uniref:CCDC144C-like coiled-coil domain-containing protein n=1 Tax=Cyclopterus lumpus TaxID=8103 RepID=A0A8C3G6A3_CYCLU